MPISFLTEDKTTRRMKRLGRVRLGVKKNHKGKEIPHATDHFVLTDAPDIAAIHGEEPTTLPIYFFFNSIEATFPHYLMRYGAGELLRCIGDGEKIRYALDEQRRVIEDPGPCSGQECDYYKERQCRSTGYLRFGVKGIPPRLGFYDLRVHEMAIKGILGQLELAMSLYGYITNMAWLLHLGPVRTTIPDKNGQMLAVEVLVPWIEIDPAWMELHPPRPPKALLLADMPEIPDYTLEEPLTAEAPPPPQIEGPVFYCGECGQLVEATNGLSLDTLVAIASDEGQPVLCPRCLTATGYFERNEGTPPKGQTQSLGELIQTDAVVRGKFWQWAKQQGLTNQQVHEALGVGSVKEFTGTVKEAQERIAAWQETEAETETMAIKTFGDLWTEVQRRFGLTKTKALAMLGVKTQEELSDHPKELFARIAKIAKKVENG